MRRKEMKSSGKVEEVEEVEGEAERGGGVAGRGGVKKTVLEKEWA